MGWRREEEEEKREEEEEEEEEGLLNLGGSPDIQSCWLLGWRALDRDRGAKWRGRERKRREEKTSKKHPCVFFALS